MIREKSVLLRRMSLASLCLKSSKTFFVMGAGVSLPRGLEIDAEWAPLLKSS